MEKKKDMKYEEYVMEKLTEEERCLIRNHYEYNEHVYRFGKLECCYCGWNPKTKTFSYKGLHI